MPLAQRWRDDIEHVGISFLASGFWFLTSGSELLFDRVHDSQEGLELGSVRRRSHRRRRNGSNQN